MAGDNGLNAQGVKKTTTVRSKFPLVHPGYVLCGGDFSGFEVVLADAVYNDPSLRQDLLSGKKIHALFGQFVYPGMSYEDILASDGTDDDKYTRAKSAVFAMFYGGEGFTLKDRLGVPIEDANAAYEKFCRRYPGVGRARKRMIDAFQTLKQTGGIGSRIEYRPAADFVESIFGFKRYFTLENMIVDALVQLAQNPPNSWKMNIKVIRRDRPQYVQGAVQSALYAAAFGMQAANMRAAANHEIQSSGATITKFVQRKIWDIQPSGASEWLVQPFNVHDELMVNAKPEYVGRVETIVKDSVELIRPKVPLIKMDWKNNLTSWADKK
jgi:DNA polymerase I-like protein with 3'-5' exonuclease and polymerase domains